MFKHTDFFDIYWCIKIEERVLGKAEKRWMGITKINLKIIFARIQNEEYISAKY